MNNKMLKDKMSERGISIKMVIEGLNINESTFYRKLSNEKKSFSVEEAQILTRLLSLSNAEATEIFLK